MRPTLKRAMRSAGNVILKVEAADGCWDPSGAITSLSTFFEPREARPRIKRRSLLRGKPGVEFKPKDDAMVKKQRWLRKNVPPSAHVAATDQRSSGCATC